MKFICYIFSFILLITNSFSQCNPATTKIMVIGDSWGLFSWTFNSYNENLDRFGFSDIRANSSINIAITGARAENYFSNPSRKQGIIDFLASNPDVEFCHISLGGNDVLGEWNNSMTSFQVDSLLDVVLTNLKKDIDTVLSLKPDLKFVISGYDYPNFVETAAFSSLHPYYDQWTDMGQPDALEINTMLARLSQSYADSTAVWNNVHFVNNNGLMQWVYGQTTPLLIPPYSTYPAQSVPLPGGDMNFPSPRAAMGLSGTDSFHLSDGSFEHFIQRHFEEYYWYALRKPDACIFASDTALNGYLSISTQSSGLIKTGKVDTEETHGIITFNTSTLSQSLNVKSASIFLKRDNLSGENLINQELTLEIKANHFGANLAIEADDFSSVADASNIACTYGTVDENDFWMRIDIPENLLSYINNDGYTQFKLKYNSAGTNNFFEFKNDTNPANQTFLDVKYDFSTYAGEIVKTTDIIIYPNPAEDYFDFSLINDLNKDYVSIELINSNGKTVLSKNYNNPKGQINTSGLPSGIYLLKITQGSNIYTSKIMINP